jgi:Xaa-Pro aminopeptidase
VCVLTIIIFENQTVAALKSFGVTVSHYDKFTSSLAELASQHNAKVWLDPASANMHLWQSAKAATIVSVKFPIAMWKAVKNVAEQNGMRSCHVQDAVALTRFLSWLEDHGVGVSETQAVEKLLQFRQEEEGFVGVSFDTILGTGANGAIIHYRPTDARPAVIGANDMVLIDSGGHYRNGTTDVTRTVHMGTPTEHQVLSFQNRESVSSAFLFVRNGATRECFRVMWIWQEWWCPRRLVQIRFGLFWFGKLNSFPTLQQLDILARVPLFSDGLDYRHGTGHGVGAFLNVHEYPPGVSGAIGDATTLQPVEKNKCLMLCVVRMCSVFAGIHLFGRARIL